MNIDPFTRLLAALARLSLLTFEAMQNFCLGPYAWPLLTFVLGVAVGGLYFGAKAFKQGEASERYCLGYLVMRKGDRL